MAMARACAQRDGLSVHFERNFQTRMLGCWVLPAGESLVELEGLDAGEGHAGETLDMADGDGQGLCTEGQTISAH